MVWGLFPVDPVPGEDKYYFFSQGTYKVGRKGCDIIVNKDKGVSRIHAEIIIDEMISVDLSHNKSSNNSSKVRIRDCSKYGTFISKNMGSKEKVHEYPHKETILKDGDMVSFGTGNATYRFCFVPFTFFMCSPRHSEANRLQDKISSIESVVFDIQFIAGKGICTEVPSSASYAPTLMLEGLSVKVADPQSREHCLRGYTFLLEPFHKYKYQDKLPLLLDVGGAKVVYVEALESESQGLEGGNNHVVRVVPTGLPSSAECCRKFSSLPKLNEMDLISAVLSGHLDDSIIVSAPVLVASSCSTDETVVADSDVEMETVTSTRASAAVCAMESAEHESKQERNIHKVVSAENNCRAESVVNIIDSIDQESKGDTAVSTIKTIKHDSQGFIPSNRAVLEPNSVNCTDDKMSRKDSIDNSESGKLDIIYSQDLIVRDSKLPAPGHSSTSSAVTNFKLFRKMRTPSGNSFHNLIPFSKYPYEESDYGNEDVVESVKEEKKRKQMEAIAEDLFNTEKGRRRAAGPLHGIFARR
ncbi:nijmegen breakage syndrome 1 protein [Olea europaea var. sylvestris]|uniref:nijmegen breakage syndrome 1 protein n=1 Tax=Olea europaea var. sylvestris TaxID=158386 RepID=UPI000C1CD46A|nr:nijmegen breakage syndrome 1 protein [Olea europaea var. sylvestris]